MQTFSVQLNKGIQSPADLTQMSSIRPKVTSKGKVTTAIGWNFNNPHLGNIPSVGAFWGNNNFNLTNIPLFEVLGYAGGSPVLALVTAEGNLYEFNFSSITVDANFTHSGHSGIRVEAITYRKNTSTGQFFYLIRDDSDRFLRRGDNFPDSSTATVILALENGYSLDNRLSMITARDNRLYLGRDNKVDSFSTTNSYSADVLDLLDAWTITALGEWNGFLVIAASDGQYAELTPTSVLNSRNSTSKVFLWDFVSPSFATATPELPQPFVSAMVNDNSGNLYLFGGYTNGFVTIYRFTGYGFQTLTTYKGSLPYSKDSVIVDELNRLVWVTPEGHLCRYDVSNDVFEILAFWGNGGLIRAGGTLFHYGSSIYAGAKTGAFNDIINLIPQGFMNIATQGTMLVNRTLQTGQLDLPPNAVFRGFQLHLTRPLESTEQIQVLGYLNQSTTPSFIETLPTGTQDIVVRNTQNNADNISLAINYSGLSSEAADSTKKPIGVSSLSIMYSSPTM